MSLRVSNDYLPPKQFGFLLILWDQKFVRWVKLHSAWSLVGIFECISTKYLVVEMCVQSFFNSSFKHFPPYRILNISVQNSQTDCYFTPTTTTKWVVVQNQFEFWFKLQGFKHWLEYITEYHESGYEL